MAVSIRLPLACKASDLPIDLHPHIKNWANPGSNWRPSDLQSDALPSELLALAVIVGFEPTRAEHNRFQVCPLNHSGISPLKKERL